MGKLAPVHKKSCDEEIITGSKPKETKHDAMDILTSLKKFRVDKSKSEKHILSNKNIPSFYENGQMKVHRHNGRNILFYQYNDLITVESINTTNNGCIKKMIHVPSLKLLSLVVKYEKFIIQLYFSFYK